MIATLRMALALAMVGITTVVLVPLQWVGMKTGLFRWWLGTGAAVIFVTNDLEEAIALADRVVVMTASPATVCGDFTITLDRPRNVEEVRLTEEFRDLYKEIWETLRDEVDAARAKGLTRAA